MKDFAFHLSDDRRADPVVRLARVRDEAAAQVLAERMLRETYHHRAVEVWEGDRRIYALANVNA